MFSPQARAALRRQWLADLEAEIARRAAAPEAADDAARQRFLADLEEAAARFASVTLTHKAASPEELARAEANAAQGIWRKIDRVRVALVDDLVAANGDWDRIDKICVTSDLAPFDAIAMPVRPNAAPCTSVSSLYLRHRPPNRADGVSRRDSAGPGGHRGTAPTPATAL